MSSGNNKKTTKNTRNKSYKENSSVLNPSNSPWKKLKKCWSKSLNHTKKKLFRSQQLAFQQQNE